MRTAFIIYNDRNNKVSLVIFSGDTPMDCIEACNHYLGPHKFRILAMASLPEVKQDQNTEDLRKAFNEGIWRL